jgi:predicted RNase H-like HicB family nuclease
MGTISGHLAKDMLASTKIVSESNHNLRMVKSMARILVIIEKGENSYGAYSPDVPGCVVVGNTREEVEALMREALQIHLQLMQESNLPLPESQTIAEYMDIPLSA